MKELQDICIDLWNDGIRPPYRLVIGDGEGRSIALDVTVEYKFEGAVMIEEGQQVEITIG